MKFDISLVTPGLPFGGKNFHSLSIGGAESASYYMAQALAALGHRVSVFTNIEQRECVNDIYYLPMALYRQYTEFTPQDVLIVQRVPEMFATPHHARFAALWCHDLALGRSEEKIKGVAWNYDRVFVLSEFMRQQYRDIYTLPDELLFLTRNGVDLATVESVRATLRDKAAKTGSSTVDIVRDPFQLVYSARPERGLDVLLSEIMPRVLAQEPRVRLALSAYYNPVDHLREFYDQCEREMRRLGDRARFVGHLTKRQLYELYLQSGLYVYPVPAKFAPEFSEIACISAMETQACGLPMITSRHGALPETLHPDAGVLVDEPVHTEAYYEEFAAQVVRLIHDREAWAAASTAGQAHAQTLDWRGVAEQWTELFEREIRARSADQATVVNHFWRRSDIYAARAALSAIDALPDEAQRTAQQEKARYAREQITKHWAFLDEPEGFRVQYERIGATHDPEVLNWSPQEPRYVVLRDWLRKHAGEVKTVLDYGCAHGAYAVNLLRELPEIAITGVDLDRHGIEMANGFAQQFNVAGRWRGVVGDHGCLNGAELPVAPYDVAVAQEVLEHVPEPWAVLEALEQRVRDGGYVYITVPFGPWEYTDYRRYPHRAHVWEFDLQDLYDMLEGKGREAQLTVNAMPAPQPIHHNPFTGEAQGWWVVMYKVTPATRGKVGRIDMARKLWCQRPRQTVSVNIMAGGVAVEETLLWCLRSLEHVADQLVVVDCGLSALARSLLDASTLNDGRLKVVPGVDPRTDGFETPRNLGLEHCTQDWVLWVDTDEKLLAPEALTKYLRANCFNGYSIKQHHFAVDTSVEPDLPVRLFRNPRYTGSGMRWFGQIHEHPETALNQGPGRTIALRDVHIPHLGYLLESSRKERFARNLPMLQADIAKYPDRVLQKHFIMRDNILLCTYELQQNGGRVTESIRLRAQEVVRLWREYFKHKGHFSNVDPITYYSEANKLLGQGFDFHLAVAADKIQARPNGALNVRFADMDDALAEVTRRTREAAQPFDSAFY